MSAPFQTIHKKVTPWSARYWLVMFVGLACIAALTGAAWWYRPHTTTMISFLDVGQGDAILLQLPNGTSVLIDGGPDNTVLASLSEVLPWWKRTIDYVVVTHPDKDHYAGLMGVAEKYTIGALLHNGDGMQDENYQLLLDMVRHDTADIRVVHQGQQYLLAPQISLDILWPAQDYADKDKNERSVVVNLHIGSQDVILTGDLGQTGERELMAAGLVQESEILKLGHHGSRTSSDQEFVRKVNPDYCVVSAGKGNSYGHPHAEALRAAQLAGCRIIRTDEQGSISFRADTRALRLLPSCILKNPVWCAILGA